MMQTKHIVGTIIVLVCIMGGSAFSNQKIKEPNVSGKFYSADPTELSSHIDHLFSKADIAPLDRHVDIVIAPHAGYVFSGGVAAYGFKAVSQRKYKTVVILAPSHFFAFDGISVWDEGGFKTPLGVVEVDEDFTKKLTAANNKFYFEPKAFEKEHSLEVEIPFLQKTFTDFKIVPVVMGQTSFELLNAFATSLNQIIGGREDVLIVVSTDLSHFHDDQFARSMDKRTIEAVAAIKPQEIYRECQMRTMEMCGCIPTVASLLYAQIQGIDQGKILKYANSGDVSGDKQSVVGYASIVFYGDDTKGTKEPMEKGASTLNAEQKKRLVQIARNTMENYVRKREVLDVEEKDERLLGEDEGAFVTIKKGGQLRGCIGHILGTGPLCYLVRNMAVNSSAHDERFDPVLEHELDDVEVEVSVLSKPWRVKSVDEIELGKHGVIIQRGANRGVFLPQVADDTGWSKEQFLSVLCSSKAKLPADCWKDPDTIIEIFTADVFSEHDVGLM